MEKLSSQLIALNERNPFVRIDRLDTVIDNNGKIRITNSPLSSRTKRTNSSRSTNDDNAQKSISTKDGPRLVGNRLKISATQNNAVPSRSRRSSRTEDNVQNCVICWSQICSTSNQKLLSYFETQLPSLRDTLIGLLRKCGADDSNETAEKLEDNRNSETNNSLPLCQICFSTVHQFWGLQSQLDLIQEQINGIVSRVKGAIWLSSSFKKIEREKLSNKFRDAAVSVYPKNSKQSESDKNDCPPIGVQVKPQTAKRSVGRPSRTAKLIPTALCTQENTKKLDAPVPVAKGSTKIKTKSDSDPVKTNNASDTVKDQHPTKEPDTLTVKRRVGRPSRQVFTLSSQDLSAKAKFKYKFGHFKKQWAISNVRSTSSIVNPNENETETSPASPISDSDEIIKIKTEFDFDDDSITFEDFHNENNDSDYNEDNDHSGTMLKLSLPNFNEDDPNNEEKGETDEKQNTDLIGIRKPRKSAQIAKSKLLVNKRSSRQLLEDNESEEDETRSNDADCKPSSDSESSSDEEFPAPKGIGKKRQRRASGNQQKDDKGDVENIKRRRGRPPVARVATVKNRVGRPKTKPEGPPKVPRPRPEIPMKKLKMMEYYSTGDFEYKGFKVVKEEMLWKCVECGDIFPLQGRVRAHIAHVHVKKPSKCTHCGLVFDYKSELTVHLSEVHTGERLYPCPYNCGQTYNNRGSLHWHKTWAHSHKTRCGPRKFLPCTVCEKRFINRSKLANHMRSHTGERPFICEICSHAASTSMVLTAHMKRNHSGIPLKTRRMKNLDQRKKTFPCTICSWIAVKQKSLDLHMRTHTSERPFECDICGHRASQLSGIKRHKEHKHFNNAEESLNPLEVAVTKRPQLRELLPPRGRVHGQVLELVKKVVEAPPTGDSSAEIADKTKNIGEVPSSSFSENTNLTPSASPDSATIQKTNTLSEEKTKPEESINRNNADYILPNDTGNLQEFTPISQLGLSESTNYPNVYQPIANNVPFFVQNNALFPVHDPTAVHFQLQSTVQDLNEMYR